MIEVNLKQILKEKGMTLTDLSQATDISLNALSSLANGKSNGIQFNTLGKILQATGAKVEDLIYSTSDIFTLSVVGVENDYSKFEQKETRNFSFRLLNTTLEGNIENSFEFTFTLLYYQIAHDLFPRDVFFVYFTDYKLTEHCSEQFAKLVMKTNLDMLNAIAHLVVTDIFWNYKLDSIMPFVAFSWMGFSRDNEAADMLIPLNSYKVILKKQFKDSYHSPKIANLKLLEESTPNIKCVNHDDKTGKTSITMYIN